VRGIDGATLEQRERGGDWVPGPALAPAPDGSFSVTVSPLVATDYRLALEASAAPIATAPMRLAVVPAVTLQTTPTGLAGSLEPARAGVRVQLRPVDGAGPADTTRTDATGAFSFAPPPPGAYRATALGGSSDTVVVS
jgi:hypothetical protein